MLLDGEFPIWDIEIDRYLDTMAGILSGDRNIFDSTLDPFSWIANAAEYFMALFANGLRLLFSLLFFTSYLVHRIVGNVIAKLWANLAESEWPIFTTLFTSLGALLAAVSGIAHLLAQ